jgi:hypothetical protein
LSAVEQHQQQHAASTAQRLPAAAAQQKHEPPAPQLAVSTGVSSGSAQQPAWLTWTDVGEFLCASRDDPWRCFTRFAGIALTLVNVAIIVSVVKVFRGRGSDATKSSLTDI